MNAFEAWQSDIQRDKLCELAKRIIVLFKKIKPPQGFLAGFTLLSNIHNVLWKIVWHWRQEMLVQETPPQHNPPSSKPSHSKTFTEPPNVSLHTQQGVHILCGTALFFVLLPCVCWLQSIKNTCCSTRTKKHRLKPKEMAAIWILCHWLMYIHR